MPFRVGEQIEVDVTPEGVGGGPFLMLAEVKEVRAGGAYTLAPVQGSFNAQESRMRPRPS